VSLSRANGWHGHDQGREGRLLDKLKVKREGREEE
jgi:hypothetical protein